MPPTPPRITVSIVSHGDALPLQDLLGSLRTFEDPRQLQLIVTDNLGHDLPELESGPWNSLRVLRNEKSQGYARNHNAAFRHAEGSYFCIVNPDVLFLQSTLVPLIAEMESAKADITAPLVVDPHGTLQDSFRSLPTPLELLWRRVERAKIGPRVATGEMLHPDWIAGIFLLMRSETFSRLGGFDPRYHLYFEDVDLCTRARLTGLGVVVNSRLRLQHDARRASRRPGRHLLWHLQSAVRFFGSAVYRRGRALPEYDG
jgi:N-acetylglucosaminyl-diphospho-decaprenol L-rhamnosyltransferase